MVADKGPVAVNSIISSGSESYEVKKILGSGAFGVVSLCHKLSTDHKVALKMINIIQVLENPANEAAMLHTLMEQGGARAHIVEWFGSFFFKDHYVHKFEVLDMCLVDYIQKNGTLKLKEIRPLLHQMGTALSFLKTLGIVHADLKHDNIMMVDTVSKPLQIKIIDFGLARHVSHIHQGIKVQTRNHRAPEVFLGAPYDQGIDMWSIGCMIIELFLGYLLFPGCDEHDLFCSIIKTVGLPSDELLEKGRYTNMYLTYEYNRWLFKNTYEVAPTTSTLASVFKYTPVNEADKRDSECFLDLVSLMLKPDPAKRISPEELLKHPFITMEHLKALRDLHPDHVLECEKSMWDVVGCVEHKELSCSDIDDDEEIFMDSRSSEEKHSLPAEEPRTSTEEKPSAPSKSCKRKHEEDQDTMYSKRLCVGPVSTPEGPSRCEEPAPAPESPIRSVQSVVQSKVSTVRRKRRHETEAESSDLHHDSDLKYGKRLCVGPVSTPVGPSCCEEPNPAPEDPICSEQSAVHSPDHRMRRKRRHETAAMSSDSDSDNSPKRRVGNIPDINPTCDSEEAVGSAQSHCTNVEDNSKPSEDLQKSTEEKQSEPSPSRKRRWKEDQDTIPLEEALLLFCKENLSCNRLCVGPVIAPEGPYLPEELVPVPEGLSRHESYNSLSLVNVESPPQNKRSPRHNERSPLQHARSGAKKDSTGTRRNRKRTQSLH
ncbi:mitogen-activated protein kinase 9-like [Periophthalmus magnuspinnatus]|uniref:mitogen-activated protein kinase 9-like n=1 Tax=Periophthalmus magnuspinnatus TaxID=409849 RepID=UPI00145B84A4|nr:mitogen-activated protein kinase 9-like [Periophthalmus magnuspinnatus]